MFGTSYFSLLIKARYILVYLFPVLFLVGIVFAINFAQIKQHNIVELGQYESDKGYVAQYNQVFSQKYQWIIYLHSVDEPLCATNSAYLQQFDKLLRNGILQNFHNGIQIESYLQFQQTHNGLQNSFCSEDKKNTYYNVQLLQDDNKRMVDKAQIMDKIIKDIEQQIKYQSSSIVSVDIKSPATNAFSSMHDFGKALRPIMIIITAIIFVMLCVFCKSQMIFIMVSIINLVYIFSISNLLNYTIYLTFGQNYSSYSFYFLTFLLILNQASYTVRYEKCLTQNITIAQAKCQIKLNQLQQKINLKNQATIMQQIQQGVTIPTSQVAFEQQQNEQQDIKYKSVIQSMYETWRQTFRQEIYIYLIWVSVFLFTLTFNIQQLTVLCLMSICTITVSEIVNEFHTIPLLILNCNFLYKFQEFNFRLKYQYITCIKHLEETEYDEQTDLNGNDNSGNDELEQLFDMVVDTQQYNYGNNIPFARNLSDEKEMLLKDSSQVDQTIKQDQFLQKQKLKQKFELIFSIKNYLKKIYENKPAQIATIVITVLAAVGFGMGLINTEHGINISYLLDSSKQKDKSTIQFQQQFNGARMSPYTININCSESVVTKVQQEALYLAVLNIIHEFSKQFSEQPQLQISEKDFQCPFLINSEFISISRKAELEQIYKDLIGGKDLSDYSVFDINQSVAYNYVYNTQTSSNNQNFFCYVYPNISINGELTKQFVPYMRSQMSQFQKVMQNYNQTFGVSAVILGYGAHINDIGQRVHSFLATYILCVCAIAFGITGGLVFSIANITSQIIYFSLVFLFSTVIINVIYHIFQKQMLNPFLHIFNTAVSMSMVSSSMSVILLKLRTQYLKKRDLKTALLSIADDCLSQLQTNLLIILTTWILILSNVEILRQIGIILFSNGIIMTVFVVPFGFIGFYCLLGQVGLWPYKKYIALGE
ncbi:Conserved_hypothetical protein [Hexamita inflata]|uniref:Uncharacterized protein n=1 Tax=Hexamita inflata TaxID=28002 RepID=A0ABP1HUT8_9EUKA